MKTKYIIGIVSAISIIVIIYIIVKYVKYYRNNPVLIKNPLGGKNYKMIMNDTIKQPQISQDFTYHMWLYVCNWGYKYGQWKHILNKGKKKMAIRSRNDLKHIRCCPGIFLEPRKNNLVFVISGKRGNIIYVLKDIPIKRWFDIALVVYYGVVEIYFNGKLIKTIASKNIPRINNANLHINNKRGFSGLISALTYSPRQLNTNEIIKKHIKGPYIGIIKCILNKINFFGMLNNFLNLNDCSGDDADADAETDLATCSTNVQ